MNLIKSMFLLLFLSCSVQAKSLQEAGIYNIWPLIDRSKLYIPVGVLDTGINVNAPGLANHLYYDVVQPHCFGFDGTDNDCYPFTSNNHGTYVGQIIIRTYPMARIVPIKVIDLEKHIYFDDTLDIIVDYILANPAIRVINISISSRSDTATPWLAIEKLRQAGVLVVVAAGNRGENIDQSDSIPATYDHDNIIVVGASHLIKGEKVKKRYSNWGVEKVDLFTQDHFYVLKGLNEIEKVRGTSFAAPKVAGVAAMLFNEFPHMTYRQVKNVILDSVDLHDNFINYCTSGGTLNAHRAFKLAQKRYGRK